MRTEIQNTVKQFSDVYGYGVIVEMLKQNGYLTTSIANTSIPSMGSPCYKIEELDTNLTNVEIEKVICHNDESITLKLKMPYCNLRFWK